MKSELPSNITSVPGVKPHGALNRWSRILVAILCWGYLLLLVALIAVIRTLGDQKWRVTLMLFSPRWPALLPLVILIPLALWLNRRMLIVICLSIIAAVFPLMGFNLGWHRLIDSRTVGMPMRVVAFNIHHTDMKSADVGTYLLNLHADVIAIEEATPGDNRLFPRQDWHVRQFNELLIASKYPILSASNYLQDIFAKFTVKTPSGPVDIVIVHLSSPHYALKDAVRGIDQGSAELAENIRERSEEADLLKRLIPRSSGPLIIAGDFNLLPDSPLFTRGFDGMTDSFESVGFGFGWTYDNQWTSVRIDHVLTNSSFTPAAFSLGPQFASSHFPIIADLILKTP